ncbi:preferentially expressed antigen in melanoma-like protein 1 [Mesocricetus auratus]|uniref:Preferentially expressed antigen in melanoma-like protein 1 n=1 Tax=Mesocricetus auratus TaxID=10036 RepID=A0ABM2WRD8_MESAU|nr:preferentially expressed antigen in melanoma-like protein 1 [Mesocricetus auratus]XP_040590946.1 preferentially expressed antigen in melanoma-like protein 1 [Mesocricetus auratus]
MSSKDVPPLQELAMQTLLRDENLIISSLGKLPPVFFLELFKQACERGLGNVLKKMVASWPFPRLPLGAMKKRNFFQIQEYILEEIDRVLIQKVRPREYKLEVLDLRSVGQSCSDVWSGPIDNWLPQTSSEAKEGGKQPLKVAVNLYLRNDPANKLFFLSQWAKKRKGLLEVYCYELQIWLPSLSDCKYFLECMNLHHIEVLGLYCLRKPAFLLNLNSYLGHMTNLRKLSLSNLHEESLVSPEERKHIISGFASQLLNMECLQKLHLDNTSFFQGHLHQLLGSLKTPLDDLAVTNCQVSDSDWYHLSKLPCVSQLKQLSLENIRLVYLSPEPLRVLLVKSASTLVSLSLEDCHMKARYLYAILPALSNCLQLTTFNFYGNQVSKNALKKLLRHTASLKHLSMELYPIPKDCYEDNGTLHMEYTGILCDELMDTLKAIRKPGRVYFGADRCHECNIRYIYNKTMMCKCRRIAD